MAWIGSGKNITIRTSPVSAFPPTPKHVHIGSDFVFPERLRAGERFTQLQFRIATFRSYFFFLTDVVFHSLTCPAELFTFGPIATMFTTR